MRLKTTQNDQYTKLTKKICLFSLIFYCFLCYGRSEINNDDELHNGGPTNFFKGVFFNATIKQFSDPTISQWMLLSELLQASTDFSFFCFSASSASIFFTSFTFSRALVCRQTNSSKKCLTFTFQRPFLMQNVLFYNSHNLYTIRAKVLNNMIFLLLQIGPHLFVDKSFE